MTRFEPAVENPDLDVHPNPEGLWSRIAVTGRWEDAKRTRARWPHATVVAPLRTVRGIDLLVRDLMANPQVRILIIDGPDLTPDHATTRALFETWESPARPHLSTDLLDDEEARAAAEGVLAHVSLISDRSDLIHEKGDDPKGGVLTAALRDPRTTTAALETARTNEWSNDRPGGRAVRPPPAVPVSESQAPHGDPGDRIAADLLREVWAPALDRVLRYGRVVSTQYGDTRELLNLVTVIRDPAASVPHLPPEWKISPEAVQLAYERMTGPLMLEGVDYNYGPRLRGRVAATPGAGTALYLDQVEEIENLLRRTPGTRAAFLTPWWHNTDPGKESGRPCLVGVTFRAVPDEARIAEWSTPMGDPRIDEPSAAYAEAIQQGRVAHAHTLHTTVVFRSHDIGGAYPANMAAVCMWACELSEKLGMTAGPVTCISQSAHIYAHGVEAAEKVVKAFRHPAIVWDQRATFMVDIVRDAPTGETPCTYWHCGHMQRRHYDGTGFCRMDGCDCEMFVFDEKPRIRVQALTPDGSKVVGVWEGDNPGALALQIERSGMIQSVGNAIWLGRELEKAAAKLRGAS